MSLASSSLKTGGFISIWAPSSQYQLPCQEWQDPSYLSDMEDMDEAVDNELLLLLNPRSREGDGNWGGGNLWSLHCLLQFWPLGDWHGDDWLSEPPSLGVSFMGEPLGWSNLKGCWVDRFTCGFPGLLTFMWWSVMVWVIAHWPWIVMGSAVRQAGFPIHVPTPISRNVVSLASSAVRPSSSECLP